MRSLRVMQAKTNEFWPIGRVHTAPGWGSCNTSRILKTMSTGYRVKSPRFSHGLPFLGKSIQVGSWSCLQNMLTRLHLGCLVISTYVVNQGSFLLLLIALGVLRQELAAANYRCKELLSTNFWGLGLLLTQIKSLHKFTQGHSWRFLHILRHPQRYTVL